MSRKAVIIALAAVFALGAVIASFIGAGPSKNVSDSPQVQSIDDAFAGKSAEESVEIDVKTLPEVVAQVNGGKVSREVFVRSFSSLKNELQRVGRTVTNENIDAVKRNLLDSIINTELLYQESENEKVSVDDKEILAQFAQIRSQFQTEEEFNKTLAHELYTADELKMEIRKGKMINSLLEANVYGKVNVSEVDAKKFYDENSDKFKQPETVKARHILIKLDQNADSDAVAKAEKQMEEITNKQKEGVDFEELAKQYSEGPSAPNGGDLGYFPRGAMVPEFEKAAFALKPGEVSGIVRTQFGLHLIKVEDTREAGVQEFTEVKDKVIDRLKMLERKKVLEGYIAELRKKADIKTFI
ncbi:MAG: peptidylprolyl isomerase [Nitrospinota bacterium]